MSAKTAFCLAFMALPTASAFLFPASHPISTQVGQRVQPTCGMRVAPETRRGAAVAASAATQAKADTERELTLADVKGSNSDPVWSEVPEELYFIANYAAALGGEYPPENVDKSYWEQIKPATYTKLAALAKTADPTTISSGQYLMLMEAIVRDAIAADPKMTRPSMEEPTLTEQQEYIYNWIQTVPNSEFLKFKEEYKLEDMSPADWWSKIDEIAKDNAAKGVNLPEMTLDLTKDDFLGVAREEFVKSIKQFLKVESELYPVFIISKPGCEEGAKLVNAFNKTMDIPVRTYEVFGFDAFNFKVKADYDWGEARLEAIEELTGSKELPLVYVGGKLIGGAEKVNAQIADGSLKKTVATLRQAIVDMVEARFPKQEEESMYIGMRKVTAAEYKAYEAFQAKTGGLDPLEVNRKKAKEAAQNK